MNSHWGGRAIRPRAVARETARWRGVVDAGTGRVPCGGVCTRQNVFAAQVVDDVRAVDHLSKRKKRQVAATSSASGNSNVPAYCKLICVWQSGDRKAANGNRGNALRVAYRCVFNNFLERVRAASARQSRDRSVEYGDIERKSGLARRDDQKVSGSVEHRVRQTCWQCIRPWASGRYRAAVDESAYKSRQRNR